MKFVLWSIVLGLLFIANIILTVLLKTFSWVLEFLCWVSDKCYSASDRICDRRS